MQALLLGKQRELLRTLGARAGADVLFLKAAWADPVLYGGVGRRLGSDVDVLVPADRFEAMTAALIDEGFNVVRPEHRRVTHHLGAKEWTFVHAGTWMPVDLHRDLADAPWFDVDVPGLFARARDWTAEREMIRSLGPEDQVVHAAVHYANHLYDLDGRHADDIARLAEREPLDWTAVFERAQRGGFRLPLVLLGAQLAVRGVTMPTPPWAHAPAMQARTFAVRRWVLQRDGVRRRRGVTAWRGTLLERPLLSDRWTALPRWLARWAGLRALDALAR